jgi:shikimate kinase
MGFMATGKSIVGREFARILGWPFADTDELVEQRAGKSIGKIFGEDGEGRFRQLESEIVRELATRRQWVIALGGGAVVDSENWRLVSESGLTVCITASLDVLCARIAKESHRPLITGSTQMEVRNRIQTLLAMRTPFYENAQYSFENNKETSAEEFAMEIYRSMSEY